MIYFQRVRGRFTDTSTLSGVFRRPDPEDSRSDEKFNFVTRRWERTLDLQHILTGRTDDEVVEVVEVGVDDIRAFLATKLPAAEVDEVLAEAAIPPVRPDAPRYYAIIHNGFTREWPSGLRRRTPIVELGSTRDEAWTARKQWEPTTFFIGPAFGDFSNDDVAYVEIDEDEAELIRPLLGARPRGGPFTTEGQRWLAEHPDDRAAIYLGVSAPVYDSAGRLVTPMGPVPGRATP